jgi:ADP-heptose:LPS heptosyltransferase
MIRMLKEKKFDAAVVFTVFSQNPMPSIMLAYLADIPRRLAYCRENPYELLTDWVIEEEPYAFIRHQVKRDRDLVKHVGATVKDDRLKLTISNLSWQASYSKLLKAGLSTEKPWIIFHPGVSEKKREYPIELWAEAGKMIVQQLDYQIVITGTGSERKITERIESDIGENALSVAGMFDLHELIGLIQHSPLVISVNTGIIHIAAATQTKIIVLYALTNPQHTPWKAIGKILPYSIPQDLQSKNQVLQFVQQTYFHQTLDMIQPEEITAAAREILIDHQHQLIPELVISSTVVL